MQGEKLLLVLLLLLGACLQWVQSGKSSRHRDSHRHPREHRDHRQHRNITLAIILPQRNTAYPWAWPRVGPALDRAIDTINTDPALLPGHHLGYVFENSENEEGICSESIAPLMAVDLKFAYDPWAFIGPGCDYTSSPVGLFTTHWDIPMVTAGAPAVGFNGINMYPSITNTGPTHKKLGKFGLHICKHFEWKEQVLLMFSDNKKDDRPCYFAVEGLYTELHLNNITSVDLVFEENTGPVNYSDLLHNIKQDGRGGSPIFTTLYSQLCILHIVRANPLMFSGLAQCLFVLISVWNLFHYGYACQPKNSLKITFLVHVIYSA